MSVDLTRELAEALQLPALKAEFQELRELVEKLRQERESGATAARSDHTATRMLRLPEVAERTGVSRQTIYRWIKAGQFPKQVKLGASAVRWCEVEVEQWIALQRANGHGR